MSGGGQPSQTTSVTKTELPQWVNDAGQANYNEAVRIGNKPLEQFQGQRVASPSAFTNQAYGYLSDNLGAGQADTASAANIYSRMADPSYFAQGLSGYMNPYVDNVESKALGALNQSRTQALMQNSDRAIANKSFGGSRSAIVDAVTNAEAAKEAGILSAGLRKDAFDTASSTMRSDMSTAASGLTTTGAQKQSEFLNQLKAMFGAGQTQQQQSQSEINAEMAKFDEGKNKDIEALNLRSSTLGMAPYNTTATTNSTGTSEQKGMDPASLILGILSLGMGAF
jgi:hypothetical protein